MKFKNTKIKVVKNKKELKKNSLSERGFFSFSQLIESGRRNLRKALFSCFKKAKEENIDSLTFLSYGFRNHSDSILFSKLAAQEFFRYLKDEKNNPLKEVLFITDTDINYKLLKKNIIDYLEHLKNNKGPFLTVDGIVGYKEGIVLIKRTNPPFGWALPGGFVDYGESLEKAVVREVKEETNLSFRPIKQFRAYSQKKRDPRFHTVSVVFYGQGRGYLKAASDAQQAEVFRVKKKNGLNDLPGNIAFDHRKIIKDWLLDLSFNLD